MPKSIGGSSFKAPSLPKSPPAASTSKAPNTVSTPSSSTTSTSKKRPLDASDASSSEPNKLAKTDIKDNTTEARLKRAKLREDRRQSSADAVGSSDGRSGFVSTAQGFQKMNPKIDGKQRVETPFGPVNASKFPTSDPAFKITSQAKKDYGNQKVGDRYSHLVDALKAGGKSDKEIATDLLNALDGKAPQHLTDNKSKNAAAKLTAIMNVSEPMRVGGSGKAGRATLRAVQDGTLTLDQAFKGDSPAFPMAKNPDYMRRAVNYNDQNFRKEITRPEQFDKLGGYMSDSSGDES
ncbi:MULTISPECIES: hypothetical protein [unclassified Corallococcus]|uniref:hypothetical protein n=1 Tax=unclassified Corallococcus TaxID=2685029 RepID=UPI001A90C792|nr:MULTISPECIES: hypothetical protein [unclassified Corallococcus]MBN9687808.1 hypothetical protein [Corallococcus sp. NCSPR001]WAS88380.1 hypothetical protein O0N60_15650 [Corallococcus sp. NCRR]